jgi:ketosteroid isomerase-like protein
MDNSEIIAACRLAFTGFEKNDRTELVRLLGEDVVFDFSDSLPYGGRYVGKAEFLAFWKHVADKWQYFYYDAHDVLQDRDYVLVPVATKALSPENILMENEHMFLFKVRDGRIIYARSTRASMSTPPARATCWKAASRDAIQR